MLQNRYVSQDSITRTSFSPSPTHLLVKLAALMLKNVARLSVASAFASIVLPLPGGPYSRMPRTGARSPEKMSARSLQQQQ
jgi:hypothetical protein